MSNASFAPVSPRKPLWKRLSIFAGGLAVLAACLLLRYYRGADPAQAKEPEGKSSSTIRPGSAPQNGQQKLQVMAIVNREEISRNDLARHCLWHYGKQVVQSMVNKRLIIDRCRELNIQVTQAEVDYEIDRVARKFSLPVDQWLKMLESERNITAQQYGSEIIWPTLALRKLAAHQLQVTPQELAKAKETYYGEAIKARMIACSKLEKAREVHAKALANPDDFGNLAKQYSDDINTASTRGLIQPIRKHIGDPQIELAAFQLEKDQISQVIPAGGQFIILKCEERLPPKQPPQNADEALKESIRESKLREAAAKIFDELKERATLQIVFDDEQKSKQMPGVAAIVNQGRITTLELAEECIARHGVEVLNGLVSRRVLEQACKKRNVVVTDKDLDEEIARAAVAMGKVDKDNRPDVAAWLKTVQEEQGIEEDIYVHDAVWPSAALKKMVGGAVNISKEDLDRGYEANYGPRVKCLAIVLGNQRLAQEVWEKARAKNTSQFFGDLAEQYSVEASSRALRGEVKPIQKHGGQPNLEQEAFKLQPGELSSIIQVADKFVILRCEGYTEPVKVNRQEVEQLLYEDLQDKKLRVAMSAEYDRLMETAQIDNYLAGTTQSGRKGGDAVRTPGPQQVPLMRQPGQTPARQPSQASQPAGAPPRR